MDAGGPSGTCTRKVISADMGVCGANPLREPQVLEVFSPDLVPLCFLAASLTYA